MVNSSRHLELILEFLYYHISLNFSVPRSFIFLSYHDYRHADRRTERLTDRQRAAHTDGQTDGHECSVVENGNCIIPYIVPRERRNNIDNNDFLKINS